MDTVIDMFGHCIGIYVQLNRIFLLLQINPHNIFSLHIIFRPPPIHYRRRCEAILRSKPDSRAAAEIHLACIDAIEEAEQRKIKKAAAGTVAVAALGAVVAIGGMLVAKR